MPSQRDAVKIRVGDDNRPPYLIQQQVLENSSTYFAKALAEGRFEEGQQGAIHLKDDDQFAWMILLRWMTCHKLHDMTAGEDQLLLINCWILGDKYEVHDFQDAVMLKLLGITTEHILGLGAARKALENTMAASPLRRSVCEEMVYAVRLGRHSVDALDFLDGLRFFSEYIKMSATLDQDWTPGTRWTSKHGMDAPWKSFMVGDGGPKEYTKMEKLAGKMWKSTFD